MHMPAQPLLGTNDPAAATLRRGNGASPFVIVCDHAGKHVPAALHDLGLPQSELSRHIGWDIGAAGVSEALGAALDAATMLQTYSRLVIDCNRPPGHATSIPAISDRTPIPGNAGLTVADRAAREAEIFQPYQAMIAALLDARAAAGQASVLIAMHSFTPVYQGTVRPMHAGMLFDRDPRLGLALGRLLRRDQRLIVADNEPYALDQVTDYTVPVHGEQRGLICLEIEIRQDLIAEDGGQADWAARLAEALPPALAVALEVASAGGQP
jgi:predicted N-formylglutamate amidohydrolase